MKSLYSLWFLCLVGMVGAPLKVVAQDWNHYQGLKSANPVPTPFRISSGEKYRTDLANNTNGNDRERVRKAKDEFYLQSNFGIDELLLSGEVLFNDSVSQYLNRLTDTLLYDEPELRKQLHVFTIRTEEVNAFTTNSGVVLVTLGILSKVENEAQLAFILCHEFVHYIKKHSLDRYIESEDNDNARGKYADLDEDQRLLEKSNYSKSKETESDLEGLERYLRLGYDPKEALKAFDFLANADAPFSDLTFKDSFLETKYFKLPPRYSRSKARRIALSLDEDRFGSHPGALNRKRTVNRNLAAGYRGGKIYKLDTTSFEVARERARFELSDIYLAKGAYASALYNAYSLLDSFPNSTYLHGVVSKALYAMAKFTNAGKRSDALGYSAYTEGQLGRVERFLYKIPNDELSLLATTTLWELSLENPGDSDLRARAEDLLFETLKEHEFSKGYFSTLPPEVNADSALITDAGKPDRVEDSAVVNIRSLPITLRDEVYASASALGRTVPINLAKVESFDDDDYDGDYDSKEEVEKYNPELDTDSTDLDIDSTATLNDSTDVAQSDDEDDEDISGGSEDDDGGDDDDPDDEDYDGSSSDDEDDEEEDEALLAKEQLESLQDIDYTRYAWIDLLKDSTFTKAFRDARDSAENGEENEYVDPDEDTREGRKTLRLLKKPKQLGLDKVVFVNPTLSVYDSRLEYRVDFLAAEQGLPGLRNDLQNLSSKVGLQSSVIDRHVLDTASAQTFNTLSLLGELQNELENLDDDMSFITSRNSEVLALSRQYGTPYFVWVEQLNRRESSKFRVRGPLFLFPFSLLSAGIDYLLKPKHNMGIEVRVMDVRSGKLLLEEEVEVNYKGTNTARQALLYDVLRRIHAPRLVPQR